MSLVFISDFKMTIQDFIIFSTLVLFTFPDFTSAISTINPDQSLIDDQTLISSGQSFESGFFSPGNSNNKYFGVWYKDTPNVVVWVANKGNPITGPNRRLSMTNDGNLLILDGKNNTVWSSNTSGIANNPTALLLESGNLVITNETSGNDSNAYFWQSFDFLSDTLLPGMNMIWNENTSLDRYLISWTNASDPSPGEYTYRIDNPGLPQLVLRRGLQKLFRTGPWNGIRFSGFHVLTNTLFRNRFVYDDVEAYYNFEPSDDVITRLSINESGSIQRLVLIKGSSQWNVMYTSPNDMCDNYERCGANAICTISASPICGCLPGFIPKSQEKWVVLDWSDGCVRRTPLNCSEGDGFTMLKDIKLPDLMDFSVNMTMNLKECRAKCMGNCSCTAYANAYITDGGSGCLMWFGNLNDIKAITDTVVQDIYIRLAASEIESMDDSMKKKRKLKILVVVIEVVVIFAFGLVCWYVILKKRDKRGEKGDVDGLDLKMFDFKTVSAASGNFSPTNILGEGGFGIVYKGKLLTGQLIAIKRLHKDSRQGLEEFKNEAILIAKLQHRNLVRLLGCCIKREERMLIFEYMPNKSLDNFIFDKQGSKLLDWQKRFNIIKGIARGLLYLHQDSRLNIIHRDLKTSNILLDNELNPKISDFGIARTFGEQNGGKTKRVIGTYGYMPPEYAVHGNYSVKSDIFSLGILILEIVCGKRNRGFHHPNHPHNLSGHAWLLWKDGRSMELMDEYLEDSFIESQVVRCIQVGLLCAQNQPEERPGISSVVFMLSNEEASLPQPKQPGFFMSETNICHTNASSCHDRHTDTENAVTITLPEAR